VDPQGGLVVTWELLSGSEIFLGPPEEPPPERCQRPTLDGERVDEPARETAEVTTPKDSGVGR